MTKLNSLVRKFKEFLITHKQVSDSKITIGEAKALAHDLAKIAGKELMPFYTILVESYNETHKKNIVLEKENFDLKETIKYLDGVSMLNEDLIRENDRLKQQIVIKKPHISGA